MSNDVFIADSSATEDNHTHDQDEDWKHVVEQQHLTSESKVVKICAINDVINRTATDIRVGDELFLRDVDVEKVRVTIKKNYMNFDKSNRGSISISITSGGKYRPCPHFVATHSFRSVQEILEVFPFVSDLIFPVEAFTVEGTEIPAWEQLEIVRKVEDSPSKQSLEVLILEKQRSILLPGSLEIPFVQWNKNWSLKDQSMLKKIKPRLYSLSQLCEFWSSKLHPMIVKIHDEQTCPHQNCTEQTPTKGKRFTFGLKRKPTKTDLVPSSPQTSGPSNEFYMIPETWKSKELVLEPIHLARVTNHNTGVSFTIQGDMKMKVRQLKTETPTTPDVHINGGLPLESPSRTRTFSDTTTALPLYQLNLTSLLSIRERSNAIVAVVTSSRTSGSRQPRSLALGTKIALHRTRRVRKMLFKSNDSQYFLVSAHYAGEFKRLPLVFDLAGEAPVSEESVYITRCTAYPVQKQLDSCQEGQYVWFKKHTEIQLNDTPTPTKVVHCMVSKTIDGQRFAASYPLNLRGRFEKVDDTPTEIPTRDLFRKNLPVCIKVDKYDPSIGFDPLMTKRNFQVTKIVSELTVVVEILKDGNKTSSGTLLEVPVHRCSLFVREVPLKSEDPFRGIDPYPVRKDFKGLQKLPCVEMLAECDVAELQDASRRISTTSQSIEKESSPIHMKNDLNEKKVPLSALREKNSEPPRIPRKSKSVEDLSTTERENVDFQAPPVPEKGKKANEFVNYEHAEEFLSKNSYPTSNYEHADDVIARAHTKSESPIVPPRKTRPKPKVRRKTLPSAAHLNEDPENDSSATPMSNGISSHTPNESTEDIQSPNQSIEEMKSDAAMILEARLHNAKSSEENSDRDGDYDDIQPSSDGGEYQDVEVELKEIIPAIPPRPTSFD